MPQVKRAFRSRPGTLSFSIIDGIGHAIKGVILTGQGSGESKFLVSGLEAAVILYSSVATWDQSDAALSQIFPSSGLYSNSLPFIDHGPFPLTAIL